MGKKQEKSITKKSLHCKIFIKSKNQNYNISK